MSAPEVFAGLNAEQERAVMAVRGPVCILAGAGTGKTTTVTRRIAHQVIEDAFAESEILAVTFTDKAAGEMRSRLEALGVRGVRARTFHSAAAAQLHHLGGEPLGRILPSKAIALRAIANSLPKPYRFRPAGDLAAEIEWAKNRRISVATYADSLEDHQPPIPVDLMERVFDRYERGKAGRGLVDFEDLLERAICLFEEDALALQRFRDGYRAFTVDEYQDVNPLQQRLLECWLGDRTDLCVVGDDFQSIYAFTGATPRYLLEMPSRFADPTVVRLEANYRSTPEILELANRLAPSLGGAPKKLHPHRPGGAAPELEQLESRDAELDFLTARMRRLHEREGIGFEQMAILYRVNSRSEDYEEALAHAGIPFSVRDGAFLQRQAARRMTSVLRRSAGTGLGEIVRAVALRDGWLEEPPEGLGDRELTRQNDLTRLVRLAEELDDGATTGAEFAAALERRFASDGDGAGGVNLLTFHRAKGLEYEAVFLPSLVEGDMPFKRALGQDALSEELRLFYVGITRARSHLFLTWSRGRQRPSRFLTTLLATGGPAGDSSEEEPESDDAVRALRSWRLLRARRDGVPAYVVLHDATVEAIARRRPTTSSQLALVPGIGPAKLERFGSEILEVLAAEAL